MYTHVVVDTNAERSEWIEEPIHVQIVPHSQHIKQNIRYTSPTRWSSFDSTQSKWLEVKRDGLNEWSIDRHTRQTNIENGLYCVCMCDRMGYICIQPWKNRDHGRYDNLNGYTYLCWHQASRIKMWDDWGPYITTSILVGYAYCDVERQWKVRLVSVPQNKEGGSHHTCTCWRIDE